MVSNPFSFSSDEKRAVYRAIAERRDMRHFNGQPVDQDVLSRILIAGHQAPSVGLMQPWRFIRITEQELRQQIHHLVQQERLLTAEALGDRKEQFLRLKVEGILQCSELIVAALSAKRDEHLFGRRTMPEMDLASLACAIQNIWLAARAEGIGMGWVSLFEPNDLMKLLNMPEGSQPVAILCIGHVDEFYPEPMLEMERWTKGRELSELICENSWDNFDLNP
ncbi:MAG: 5,6-dimethylbenzimidazole synthase [Reinekea sp.]